MAFILDLLVGTCDQDPDWVDISHHISFDGALEHLRSVLISEMEPSPDAETIAERFVSGIRSSERSNNAFTLNGFTYRIVPLRSFSNPHPRTFTDMIHEQHSKLKTVWIVKGIVTDPSSYDETDSNFREFFNAMDRKPKRGDVEWRVFDTDPESSSTGFSDAYLLLEQALTDYSGKKIIFVEEKPEDVSLYERWERHMSHGSLVNKLSNLADILYEQGTLGQTLDAIDVIGAI